MGLAPLSAPGSAEGWWITSLSMVSKTGKVSGCLLPPTPCSWVFPFHWYSAISTQPWIPSRLLCPIKTYLHEITYPVVLPRRNRCCGTDSTANRPYQWRRKSAYLPSRFGYRLLPFHPFRLGRRYPFVRI